MKEINRTKVIVLKDNSNVNRNKYINEVEKIIELKDTKVLDYNLSFNRNTGDFKKKELVINRSFKESNIHTQTILEKLINKKLNEREIALKDRYLNMMNTLSNNKVESEWKEQVVRVGTGFRVRVDEKDSKRRRFDVGYADVKQYKRKEDREVIVDGSSMNRTIIGKGVDARVKVINTVSDIEKRRPISKYTGSGIIRKSKHGKMKLKSTKSSSK